MSFVTTIILIFSKSENEEARIKEVNQFAYRGESIGLRSIEDAVGRDRNVLWYGGNRHVISSIYIGSYNHFDVNGFLMHLGYVNWEEPGIVQVLVKSEDEWNFNIYGNAGKDLLVKAAGEKG